MITFLGIMFASSAVYLAAALNLRRVRRRSAARAAQVSRYA